MERAGRCGFQDGLSMGVGAGVSDDDDERGGDE